MEKTEKNMVGQATPEQIKAWKEKYGTIYTTKDDSNIAYFRKPNRKELSYALRLQDDPLAMAEMVLKSCYIGGSSIFYTDTSYILGSENLVNKMLAVKKIEVGEL